MTAEQLVAAERRRDLRLGAGATAAWCGTLILAGLAAAAIVFGGGRWIEAPRWLPLVTALTLILGAATIAARGARATRAATRTERIALRVESEQGLRTGALLSALQLRGSGPLAAAGMAALDTRLARRGRPPLRTQKRHLLPVARPLGALVLAIILLAVAAPSRRDGIGAVLRPVQAWRGDLLPTLTITDAPDAVRRGTSFPVAIVAPGRRHVTFRERQTGSAWSARRIELDPSGRASVTVGPVNGDVALALTDGRASSAERHIAAVDRAYLGPATITVVSPEYLGGTSERVAPGVALRVARGSTILVSAQGTVPLQSVLLVAPRDSMRLETNGQRTSGRLVASSDARWDWRVISMAGDTLDAPAALDISVLPDSAPAIAIAAPGPDTLVATGPTVTVRLIASDDHGLSLVRFDVLPDGGKRATREVARALPARWGADVGLDVASLGLHAGDALRLTAVAVDNSPWRQEASSRTIVIRVPGASEQRERARAAADSLVATATAAAAGERDLARRAGEAARDRGTRQPAAKPSGGSSGDGDASSRPRDAMSYETEQRARAVREEQQKLSSTVSDMQKRAADLQKQLDRAGALDSSLASQLRDAQKLIQEALTPELAASLAALDTALKSRSSDGARASLTDLARQQEQLRQQLDRVAEMLSRAAIEGSLKTLQDEAREVAAEARQRADSLAANRAPQPPAPLENRASKVAKEAASLAERLRKQGGESSASQASEASAHAKASASALAGEQNNAPSPGERRAKADPPNGENASAAAARLASAEMEKAADALSSARKQQIGAWKSELASELDRSIQEMMQLAEGERALEEQSRSGASPSSLRPEQSALQQGVEKTSERLEKASRSSSLLSNRARSAVAEARRQSTRATNETAKPQGATSRGAQDAFGNAADALTKAAAALVRDRERVNASETATGFSEMLKEMQQLAKQQGALNGQAASLFQMPGASGAGSEQARGLAKQQRSVARALDELGDADGSGRAEALAAEARRVAEALERGDMSTATKSRQEQLLRRMLDAGRSLEGEEKDEGKREATSATGIELFTPGTTDATGAKARQWREPTWEELRGLSAEERRAVIDYFRRMNAEAKP